MQVATGLKFPLHLLVLDTVGTVLLGIGLADWFAGTELVPASLRFEDYPQVMAATGALLMLPFIVFIVKLASARAQSPQDKA